MREERNFVFVRNNMTGRPSLKGTPVVAWKQGDTTSTFFEDLAGMHNCVTIALNNARAMRSIVSEYFAEPSNPVQNVIAMYHPALKPEHYDDIIEELELEAELLVKVWKRRLDEGEKWKLAPQIEALYTKEQFRWRPELKPGNPDIDPTWIPFMPIDQQGQHHLLLKLNAEREKRSAQYAAAARGEADWPEPEPDVDEVDDIELEPVEGVD